MSVFKIKKAPAEFVIPEDSFKSFLDQKKHEKYVEVLPEKQSEGRVSTIYILPSAFDELNTHINWKRRTTTNQSEQGGILVGNVYRDKDSQMVCGVVHHVIPSNMTGNTTYIQFTHDDWISMYKEFEEKYSPSAGDQYPLSVIGWYHTHPNMPVNMSAIDKHTHTSFFPNAHQFSVIINPQRGIWAAFNGAECQNCNGALYYDKDIVFIEPESTDTVPAVILNASDHIDSIYINSFVIKRQPTPLVQNNVTHPTNTSNVPNRVSDKHQPISYRNQQRSSNQFRSNSLRYRGRTYYYPFHKTSSRKNYIISDKLIGKLQRLLEKWNFSENESVSLNYIFDTAPHCLFCTAQHEFYPLSDDNNAYAQGFVCEKNNNEYLVFRNTSVSNKQDVLMVVLFSETLPDYRTICSKYCDSDCLLWLNTKDTREFLFFCIEKRIPVTQENSNFNIKNRPHTENSVSDSLIMFGREIYENLLVSLSSVLNGYVFTETDSISFQKGEYKISAQLLQKVLDRIKRYGKFTEHFSIAIGYPAIVEAKRIIVASHMDKISNLWFLLENGQSASIKFLDNDYSQDGVRRLAKFAFVISNFDLNVDSIKSKLFGSTTAFCFNIENQNYRFYRLC